MSIGWKFFEVKPLAMFLAIVLLVSACKQSSLEAEKESPISNIQGKYVSKVVQDVIQFEDGTSFDFGQLNPKKAYFLVRHAEKDTVPKGDPALTNAGALRADKLAQILKGTRIDAIYSTFYTRTLFTAGGVSQMKGMQVKPYEERSMKEMIVGIQESAEENRVLIVGHSNTTPVVANYIYGSDFFKSSFDDSDYDNLVLVVESLEGKAEVFALKFK